MNGDIQQTTSYGLPPPVQRADRIPRDSMKMKDECVGLGVIEEKLLDGRAGRASLRFNTTRMPSALPTAMAMGEIGGRS